uniref:Uncharacterized protein n=1 Tax=Rhizophora mucronata TaxID=61149 RepID=A0A2P2R5C7_RHIMU
MTAHTCTSKLIMPYSSVITFHFDIHLIASGSQGGACGDISKESPRFRAKPSLLA